MAKIIYNDIPDINVPWENYAGSSVEKFIKGELKNRCGYIYRSRTKEGDFYYLYGFTDYEQYEAWLNGDSSITPLFKVQLPNIENDTYSVNLTTNSNTQKLVNLGNGVKINLRYTSTATNPTTGAISDTYNDGTLIISRSANGSSFQEVGRIIISPTPWDNPEFKEYDITSYLVDGDNKIRIRVEDNVNGSVSSNITFQSIINTTLKIENATPTSQPLTALQLQYYIQGQVEKTLHIKVSQNGISNTFDFPIGNSTYIEVPYTTPLMSMTLESGTIDVDSWLSVDGTELVSYHEVNQFYYSDGTETDTIIILNNVKKDVVNYTNAHLFDLSLYNQNADIDIYIRSTDAETEFLHLVLNNCQVGTVYPVYATLEIESTLDNFEGVVSVNSNNFNCEPYIISIDNTEKMSPTVGADFVLNPKVRNNSEVSPNRIINSVNNTIVPSTFTGFGFINDGWVSDAEGIQVLRIPSEHSLEIQYDVLDNLTNGTTFEIDYKTYNMFDDSDTIILISSKTSDDKPLGFIMNPTECAFYTAENQTKRDQDVIFQEGERTHLAVNIIPNLANSGLNYIRFFVNGVMNREILYKSTDIFKNGTITLKIGSNNTDIDIYGIRVYKKGLSATDIRQDYMSSIPTIEEKIAYKASNDILSSNGTISYDKAKVKYNTLVWTGRVPSYSTGNQEYQGKLHIDILGDNEHSGDITNIKIKGQGSSSRGYWKWNHQFDLDKLDEPSVFTNLNGDTFSGYALTDNDPEAKKLVAKLNWASSMQSHKLGSTALYTDYWKKIVGGNSISNTPGYENVRVSVHEKPFLYFVKDNDSSQPVFYGLMTFGSAKYDKPTFGYDKKVFPDYLILEGSDNGMPLTLRQVPWIDGEVVYNAGEEYYEYAGQGNLDYGMGNQEMLHYFKDAFNFSYLHSPRLRAYTQDSELTDTSYQYWNTSTKNVKRYDWISNSWVDASIVNTTPCEYHSATQEDVDNNLANKVGEKVVDVLPVYEVLNLETQTGLLRANYSSDADYTTAVINWRVSDFKSKVGIYYNTNDVLYSMAILKLIAASDNWCKNTYEYLDPVTHKICLAQDDMDTIFASDNVGRKTKPYYVEEHDIDPENKPYFNGDTNNFFCLMEKAFESEEKNMMRQVFNTMRNDFETPKNAIQHYFFDVQEYFPAVAYNETARLLYEEASVAESQGIYDNATPPITQSLGDQLQAEKQWWNRRIPYLQSWSSADPFYTRSTVEPNIMFRSMTTTAGNNPTYQFNLTPWQWLYPKVGTGQYLSTDAQRVQALIPYTTVLLATDGNTDTYIYGSDYYTNFGEFGGVSLSEAFRLNGKRLLEFSADSRNVASYEFRPRSMTINCPALKRLSLYGCSTLSGSLDLTTSTKLEEVDLRETNLSGVILPESSKLTTAYLPAVASLTVLNLPNLSNLSLDSYDNIISITTDNQTLAETIINNASSLQNVDLRNVNIRTTSANVNKYIDILTNTTTTCNITGSIYLDTTLTNEQITAIETKFNENVWDSDSSFYISYRTQPITTVTLSSTNGTIFSNDAVTVNVNANGNNVESYDWSVESTNEVTLVKKKNSLVISTRNISVIENIVVTYTLRTTNSETFTRTINISTCNIDFHIKDTTHDYSLYNASIDYYIGSSQFGVSGFNIYDSSDNLLTDYSFSGNNIQSGGYDSTNETGYINIVLSDKISTNVKCELVYNYSSSIVLHVPFTINTIPVSININPVNTINCYGGNANVHLTWNIPSSYSGIITSVSNITIPQLTGKYTVSNLNNYGCDLSISGVTSNTTAVINVNYNVLNSLGNSTGFDSITNVSVKYFDALPTIIAKYLVSDTSTYNILNSSFDVTKVATMKVDNVDVTPSLTYQFSSSGEHTIEFTFNTTSSPTAGYYYRAFYNITTLISVTLTDIGKISESMFAYCSNLNKVEFNGTLTNIYNSAFGNCSSLNQIISNASTTPILNNTAFQNVAKNGTLVYPSNIEQFYINGWLKENEYYLGYYNWNSVLVVNDNILYKIRLYSNTNDNLNYASVERKTDTSTQGAQYSGDIVIASTVMYEGKSYPVTVLNYQCFYQCSSLTSVTLPNSITEIKYSAFNNTTNLNSVTFGTGLTTIGESAFKGSGISSIVIPEGVTQINDSTFSNCSNLTTVTIPSTVTRMKGTVYYHGAFAYCTKLNTIIINRSTAPTIEVATFGTNEDANNIAGSASGTNNVLYVPSGATGYNGTNWTNFLLNQTEGYGKFTISETL